MLCTKIGDIEVHRILEWEAPFMPAGEMFPDAAPAALARHRAWLGPRALCPESGRLILPVQSYLVKTKS